MDNFTNNPGFQHIAEEIFLNLNMDAIQNCKKVNQYWNHILNQPSFLQLRQKSKYFSHVDDSY